MDATFPSKRGIGEGLFQQAEDCLRRLLGGKVGDIHLPGGQLPVQRQPRRLRSTISGWRRPASMSLCSLWRSACGLTERVTQKSCACESSSAGRMRRMTSSRISCRSITSRTECSDNPAAQEIGEHKADILQHHLLGAVVDGERVAVPAPVTVQKGAMWQQAHQLLADSGLASAHRAVDEDAPPNALGHIQHLLRTVCAVLCSFCAPTNRMIKPFVAPSAQVHSIYYKEIYIIDIERGS